MGKFGPTFNNRYRVRMEANRYRVGKDGDFKTISDAISQAQGEVLEGDTIYIELNPDETYTLEGTLTDEHHYYISTVATAQGTFSSRARVNITNLTLAAHNEYEFEGNDGDPPDIISEFQVLYRDLMFWGVQVTGTFNVNHGRRVFFDNSLLVNTTMNCSNTGMVAPDPVSPATSVYVYGPNTFVTCRDLFSNGAQYYNWDYDPGSDVLGEFEDIANFFFNNVTLSFPFFNNNTSGENIWNGRISISNSFVQLGMGAGFFPTTCMNLQDEDLLQIFNTSMYALAYGDAPTPSQIVNGSDIYYNFSGFTLTLEDYFTWLFGMGGGSNGYGSISIEGPPLSRPADAGLLPTGTKMFHSGAPIWWGGANWVDGTGAIVP